MKTKQVTMPDGHVIYNVPIDTPDEEVIAKYEAKNNPKEDEVVEEPSVAEDIGRVVLKTGSALPKAVVDVAAWGLDKLGVTEDAEGFVDKWTGEAKRNLIGSIPFLGEELVPKIIDEKGKVKETDTLTGMGLEIGTLFAGMHAVSKFNTMQKLPTLVNSLLSGAAVDQILVDADENIFNMSKDMMDEQDPEAKAERGMLQNVLYTISDALATDDDDSKAMKQVKLLGEGLTLGLVAEMVGGTVSLARRARAMFDVPYKNLTPEQRGEIIAKYLSEARQTASLRNPEPQIVYNETPEGAAQILQQQSSSLRRWLQQTFTSRGYWSPKAYNAFEDSMYAQRQAVRQAEDIANRLQLSLKDLGSDKEIARVTEKVNEMFAEQLDLGAVDQKEKIRFLSEYFEVPEETAKVVLEARNMIDEMSEALIGSSAVPREVKEVIQTNAGEYIRRSYRLYEDTGYMPSENVMQDAREYLVTQLRRQDTKGVKSLDELYAKADEQIEDILGGTPEERNKVFQYYASARKVNKEIIATRKDIPEPIRKLMGEIKEPAENIVLTISKMARLKETNKFFETLNNLGREGRYIFNAGDIKPEGIDWHRITGTNSVLDGKWTTPEMLSAIKEQQVTWGKGYLESESYKNFLTMKAMSQKSKTVYSHVTHLRNFLGGMQFGTANGVNPFGKNSLQTFKTLKNSITKGGDKELDTLYEKYLRLGIINTNVNVNEFRELVDLGYSSTSDDILQNISTKLKNYGVGKALIETPEDVYLATDDFFKIVNYNSELDNLRKAFPDEAIEVLEADAAKVIHNTIPNYDRVPNNIKQLKILPIGSFVSFPAEIVRTSVNIIKQASRELTSGNAVLRKRGSKRLAGYMATMSGWSALSSASYQMSGFNEEEQAAIQKLSQTPWSKDSPKLVVRGDDDKIYLADTQFLDSYSVIKEPFMAIMREIEQGEITGEDLDEYMLDAVAEFARVSLRPYIDEAILTTAVTDIVFAAKDEAGRTPNGKTIFTPGMSTGEKTSEMIYHLFDSFLPGSFNSLDSLAEAAIGTPNKTTGRPKALEAELTTNMTGVKFSEFNAEDTLNFSARAYQREIQNVITDTPDFAKDSDMLVKQYVSRQQQRYKKAQLLHQKIEASRLLVGDAKTYMTLQKAGLSPKTINNFFGNIFMPEKQSINDWMAIAEKTPRGEDESMADIAKRLSMAYASMVATPLTYVDGATEEDKKRREPFSKGGEVNVPQAPTEPDERIDKMTGLPYNVQAGDIMAEEEDRLQFSTGGKVVKFYKALKERLGDLFSDDEIAKVSKDLEDRIVLGKKEEPDFDWSDPDAYDPETYYDMVDEFDEIETIDPKALEDYTESSVKVFLDEKIDKTLDELDEMPEWIAYKEGKGWEDFSRARGYTDEQIAEYTRNSELQSEIDPDGDMWAEISDILRPYRETKESLGFNAPPIEVGSEGGQTLLEVLDVITKGAKINVDGLLPEVETQLGARQLNRLMSKPKTAKILDELADVIPEEITMSSRTSKPLPPKEREMAKTAFVSDSVVKRPVYRGITAFGNKEFDLSFAMPREIGAHVGTSGQANTVVARVLDNSKGADSLFTQGVREGNIDPDEWDNFYDDINISRKMDEETVAELGAGELPNPKPAVISKGYIRVKKPLLIDEDLGSWDAFSILSNPSDMENFTKYIPDEKFKELREEVLKLKTPFVKDFTSGERLVYQVDINRKFRKILQDAGYDSIKYKNGIEASNVGEDDWSYILFKPEQFKSVNAKTFDASDKRFNYAGGGLVAKALGITEEDIAWATKVGEQYGMEEELDGKGDAARHLALGWLAKNSKYPNVAGTAINIRELLSSSFEREMDVSNNDLGFFMEAKDKAEAEERIKELIEKGEAKYYTLEESKKRRGYAEGGEVCMQTYNRLLEQVRNA